MSEISMEGTQVKENAALTEIKAGTLGTEERKIKIVIAGANNARKVICPFRLPTGERPLDGGDGVGFVGCIGAECEAWRHWDDERGYCDKHLEDSGACQIYQQFEVA